MPRAMWRLGLTSQPAGVALFGSLLVERAVASTLQSTLLHCKRPAFKHDMHGP